MPELHDPDTCDTCQRLKAAVAAGEIYCAHQPRDEPYECELCLNTVAAGV